MESCDGGQGVLDRSACDFCCVPTTSRMALFFVQIPERCFVICRRCWRQLSPAVQLTIALSRDRKRTSPGH
jgi:hypothetical protein